MTKLQMDLITYTISCKCLKHGEKSKDAFKDNIYLSANLIHC